MTMVTGTPILEDDHYTALLPICYLRPLMVHCGHGDLSTKLLYGFNMDR